MNIIEQTREDFIRELLAVPANPDLFTESDEEIDDNWTKLPPASFRSSWNEYIRTQVDYDGGYDL